MPLFAAFVGAVIAPVGFALSLESIPATSIEPAGHSTPSAIAATTIVQVPPKPAEGPLVPDAAKLLGVGASLLAVAAVVRKAI